MFNEAALVGVVDHGVISNSQLLESVSLGQIDVRGAVDCEFGWLSAVGECSPA